MRLNTATTSVTHKRAYTVYSQLDESSARLPRTSIWTCKQGGELNCVFVSTKELVFYNGLACLIVSK